MTNAPAAADARIDVAAAEAEVVGAVGISGYLVKGPNNQTIFLPASGNRYDGHYEVKT